MRTYTRLAATTDARAYHGARLRGPERRTAAVKAAVACPEGNDDVTGRCIPYGSGPAAVSGVGRARRNTVLIGPFVIADSTPIAAANRSAKPRSPDCTLRAAPTMNHNR